MLLSLPSSVLTVTLTALIHISNALPHSSPSSPLYEQISSRLNKRASSTDQYVAYAAAGIDQMMTWYDASTGLWSNYWWNSANVLTMLADFQEYFPSKATPTTNLVFPTTLQNAPKTFAGFLNGFYDDELWWALAWIDVFDVTGDQKYLDIATRIFEDAKNVWGDTPCGGLWQVTLTHSRHFTRLT
jgi:predicted alpha-1,6-mannanase (GH76 family)